MAGNLGNPFDLLSADGLPSGPVTEGRASARP
jgi:hypothetical protein